MTEAFVVIWRNSKRGRWQVQPFVHTEASADQVGARLMEQFHGEAWSVPIALPTDDGEDARD